MKRLALMLALLGGCASFFKHTTAVDIADGVLLVGATSTAIAVDQPEVRGIAVGAGAFALLMVPVLVVITGLAHWGGK